MRKFFFGEIKSQSLNDKGMARYFKGLDMDYFACLPDSAVIDEDELCLRIDNIKSQTETYENDIDILIAPAPEPEPEKDELHYMTNPNWKAVNLERQKEYEVWVDEMPTFIHGLRPWEDWFRRQPKR